MLVLLNVKGSRRNVMENVLANQWTEDGVNGTPGVPVIINTKKEHEDATTQHHSMVVHHVLLLRRLILHPVKMITIIAERLTHVESVKKLTAWRLKSVSGIQSRRTRIFHGHGATVWTKMDISVERVNAHVIHVIKLTARCLPNVSGTGIQGPSVSSKVLAALTVETVIVRVPVTGIGTAYGHMNTVVIGQLLLEEVVARTVLAAIMRPPASVIITATGYLKLGVW